MAESSKKNQRFAEELSERKLSRKYQIVVDSACEPLIEELAAKYGLKWGERGNAKAFVEAIARQEIPLSPSNSQWSEKRQSALFKAVLALNQSTDVVALHEIVELLKEHPEMKSEYIVEIKASCRLLLSPWVSKLEQLINQQKPFGLAYLDAAGRAWTYTVRYAKITSREKRNYLECWCEETEGNQDLPELQHNWSLRLDRIADAGIVPIGGEWRSDLDTVDVEFELSGGLAHAYQKREHDIQVEWESVEPPIKRVVRQISNTFWFLREILPYGKDCVVVSPDSVQSRISNELMAAVNNYLSKKL